MSRSNYDEDCDYCDNWSMIRWRGAVASAMRGKVGRTLLLQMAQALDAMPQKRLIAENLESNGEVCALGCVGKARGLDMSQIDACDPRDVAKAFGIAPSLAQEIAYINDDWARGKTPEERWEIVRRWIKEHLREVEEGK